MAANVLYNETKKVHQCLRCWRVRRNRRCYSNTAGLI